MQVQKSLLEKFRAVIGLPQPPHKKSVNFLAISGINLFKRRFITVLVTDH
jgi:hypothetical protein